MVGNGTIDQGIQNTCSNTQTCQWSFSAGTIVTLNPTAQSGFSFDGWSGSDGCVGTGPCNVTLDQDRIVTGTFGATGGTPPPAGGLLVSNITVSNGKSYEVDTLASGKTVYIDRAYTYTGFPQAFDGQTYIRTANNDKLGTGANFLTFDVPTSVKVSVLMDTRTTQLPEWLGDGSWSIESGSVGTTDVSHVIYSKVFLAGHVALGGNGDTPSAGAASMYTVVVMSTIPPPVVSVPNVVDLPQVVAEDALAAAGLNLGP